MVLDILLKCIHIAWIIMQGRKSTQTLSEILRQFSVINISEKSKIDLEMWLFFLQMNDEFNIAKMSYEVTR